MDRESQQLQQIKSVPPGANFVLKTRRAFKMAEKGRKMILEGLCVSRIIHDKKFATLRNSFCDLPASLVQLLFDEAISLLIKRGDYDEGGEWDDDHQALLEQLVLTGHITKLELDQSCYYKSPFVSWLIRTAVQHCPKLQHLDSCDVEFCLSLKNSCVLRNKRVHRPCHKRIPLVPLERLQHLTHLSLWIEKAHRDDLSAAGLVRVVEALPKLEYLDCYKLYNYRSTMPSPSEFVALVQPVLEQNKRVLEVKSLSVRLPDLKVDFSSNLKVQKLQLPALESGHLDRLKNIGGVTKLRLSFDQLSTLYAVVEILGPHGLESLGFSHKEDPSGASIDLCRLFAAAPKLTCLKIDTFGHDNIVEVTEATEEQLRAIDFERMRHLKVTCYVQCNNFLPFLKSCMLRAKSLEKLYLERPEKIELVLRLLREHPECCTCVSKLFLGESQNMEKVLEVATRIALRSPTLKIVNVDSLPVLGVGERLNRDFPWFPRLCSSNGICFYH